MTFNLYAYLPNSSIQNFVELEYLFMQCFTSICHKETINDLVVENWWPYKSLNEYIVRWRNLYMKCELQLLELHAMEILLKNIHDSIAFLLNSFTIKTFEKLLDEVANLLEEAKRVSFGEHPNKNKPHLKKGQQFMPL